VPATRSEPNPRFWWYVAGVSLAFVVPLLALHAGSSRVLASWHGLLHAGIAEQFPAAGLPPENPFFAGEPLPYYWFYHFVGSLVSRALSIDLLHTFQLLSLLSLVVLVVSAALIGRDHLRSNRSGLLIAFLALVGANPGGAVIAAAKHLLKGAPLFDAVPASGVPTVFVTDQMADSLMTHPILGALYVGADWRIGHNLLWFLDISARGPALACLMVLLYLMLRRTTITGVVAIILVSALTAALNPIIGMIVPPLLAAGLIVSTFVTSEPATSRPARVRHALIAIAASFAGLAIAFPSFAHLFAYSGGTTAIAPPTEWGMAFLVGAFTLGPLVLLAIGGAWRSSREIVAIAAAALLMVGAFLFLRLDQGNEHNLANAAAVLLAIPAAAFIDKHSQRRRWLYPLVVLLFLPSGLAALSSYVGRPPIPLETRGRELHRTEPAPLAAMYDWIRSNTPRNAVFVVDPSDPVKMSGNVSELPAFTGRVLFTDQPSYLTPYQDAPRRMKIARDLTNGVAPNEADIRLLTALGRPVFVVSYRLDNDVLRHRLDGRLGLPVARFDWIGVYRLN
jgi:hypothetical protein